MDTKKKITFEAKSPRSILFVKYAKQKQVSQATSPLR